MGTHWGNSSDARAQARKDAANATLEALDARQMTATGAALSITFHAPSNRRVDAQNILSALKSQLDGIADALTLDDSTFDPITIRRGSVRKPGSVVIEIDLI